MNAITAYFGTDGFLPHGYCLLWRPDILLLHVTSDLIIALSYFSIPLAILWFVRQRRDLITEHKRIAVLFGVFILGCGLTHVLGVVVLWRPIYVVDGWVKAFTAAASISTAFVLWPVIPRLLRIPSPSQLAVANAHLEQEIAARREAMAELQEIRANLESEVQRRTAEVQALARRLEIATEDSVVTVAEQDAELRYTWVHNPQAWLDDTAVGRTDGEALGPEAAALLDPLKRQVQQTGEPLSTEVSLTVGGETYHYGIRITPAEGADGPPGLLVAAVNITEQVRQQEHLQVIMRELAHRAKNLLSLVEGIARQTAKAEGLPAGFIERFSRQLLALGAAHDLLIDQDWRGVDLGVLVEAQLAHVLPEARERVSIDGPALSVRPEVGQYLALALHELATNATKYGVLGGPDGALDIRWTVESGPDGAADVSLAWTEHGKAAAAPAHRGFGRQLLETVVPRALGGSASLEFGETGVVWRVSFKP